MPGHGFWLCVHCDLVDMNLGQGNNTPLGHGQQLCEASFKSKLPVKGNIPGYTFLLCIHCDLGDKTFDQGHDILVGHGHQLCKMLFKSNMKVMSYGLDTDFGYLSTVTSTT